MEENFETMQEKLYNRICKEIDSGDALSIGSEERGSNAKDIKILMDAYYENDKRVSEAYDKEEDRKKDLLIEKMRNEIDWKHFVIEAAKIGVPLLIAIGQWALFRESRDIAGKFEENHIYTTDLGRKTNLPIGIFKWR